MLLTRSTRSIQRCTQDRPTLRSISYKRLRSLVKAYTWRLCLYWLSPRSWTSTKNFFRGVAADRVNLEPRELGRRWTVVIERLEWYVEWLWMICNGCEISLILSILFSQHYRSNRLNSEYNTYILIYSIDIAISWHPRSQQFKFWYANVSVAIIAAA